jgi:hypothetical protein
MSAVSTPLDPMSSLTLPPPESCYRLTVEQYHEMAAAGILTTADRVELIEGLLVSKARISPPHALAVGVLADKCF